MPQNIEIKARVVDAARLIELIYELTDSLGMIIRQEDTFFHTPNGRLKLRVSDNNPHGQLVFYKRADQTGPKFSEYYLTDIQDAASFKICLGNALGILGVVKKTRQLYMYNNTRIHFDTVEDLGAFVELEVVLTNNQTASDGEKIAEMLMKRLQIDDKDLVSVAYMDLLLLTRNNDEDQSSKSSPTPSNDV